ncbi:MAG: TetR/AcrR family transcriptional regulator [Myxococcota bacterium]|nr:TetR/AcrR family transcriptional regulator [Myxococcota bacterium]
MARPAASPEQKDLQRARIRRAAAEVYAEKGIAGVSARAIAVRAGISTGTIYSYFANLQELMRSLWLEPVARANERLEAAARAHADPVERIRALLAGYFEFAQANPDVYRGAFLWVRPDSACPAEVEPLAELPFHRLLCEALTEGQAAGSIREGDVDELAQLLWAGVHGAISLPVHFDIYTVESADRLAPAMVSLIVRSIEA